MKEFLLWTLGLQKLNSNESAIFCGLSNNEIFGTIPSEVLNQLIKCASIEDAEKLALSSGGLRTVRALWICCQLLKEIKNGEILLKLIDLEYPYEYLVKRGKELDMANNEEDVVDDVEVEVEEDELEEDDDDLEDEDDEEDED